MLQESVRATDATNVENHQLPCAIEDAPVTETTSPLFWLWCVHKPSAPA